VLKTREGIQSEFNRAQSGGKKVLLADLIVLVAQASSKPRRKAGHDVKVPFTPGLMDASPEQEGKHSVSAEELLVDRAQWLTLTAPEMTVLARPWSPRFGPA
jgi:catalase-peroxidase